MFLFYFSYVAKPLIDLYSVNDTNLRRGNLLTPTVLLKLGQTFVFMLHRLNPNPNICTNGAMVHDINF